LNQELSGQDEDDVQPIGVHFLKYYNSNEKQQYDYDAIHFNHGFGASCLSWLPAIPKLTQRLNAKLSVAHDAPGFGFTDRPSSCTYPLAGSRQTNQKNSSKHNKNERLIPYSAAGSAAIGKWILDHALAENDDQSEGRGRRILLFGHSMGCKDNMIVLLMLLEGFLI